MFVRFWALWERWSWWFAQRWEEVLLGVICFCLFVVVWQGAGSLLRFAPRRLAAPKVEGADLREYYPELLGATVGFAVVSDRLVWAGVALVAGALLARLAKRGYARLADKLVEERKAGEVLLLYEMVSVYAAAGYSLYEALSAAAYLADLTEKPLRRCLAAWGQGPERALKKLGEDLGIPEGRAFSRVLQRAAVVGPEKLAGFLSHESANLERIRQYRVERGLGVRPIVQTLYLALPGFALMGVTLFPVGYHIARMIQSVRLQ